MELPDPVELVEVLLLEADPPEAPESFEAPELAEPELAEPPLDAPSPEPEDAEPVVEPEEEPPFLLASARESLW